MSFVDPHDTRRFNRFVKFNDDGSVAATVDVAEGAAPPSDLLGTVFLDVTALAPADLHAVRIDPRLILARKNRSAATVAAKVAAIAAEAEEAIATATIVAAVTTAVRTPPTVAAVDPVVATDPKKARRGH